MAHIHLENIHLHFMTRLHGQLALKDFLLRRITRKLINPLRQVRALDGVNLRVKTGEQLGVIGSNGAGKSTLLRLLAGIYPPTHGKRIVEGKIGSLFDISLGFEGEANGWENIAFRGYLQGETPASIHGRMQEIAEFSELGEHLDMPVRYYSSGMYVRLAFAIATSIDAEILLVDEVLAAGDLSFQAKACKRMEQLIGSVRLMVLASHDLSAVQRMCSRVIWMENGRIRQDGPAADVIAAYQEQSNNSVRAVA